jgi:hypothetical protein
MLPTRDNGFIRTLFKQVSLVLVSLLDPLLLDGLFSKLFVVERGKRISLDFMDDPLTLWMRLRVNSRLVNLRNDLLLMRLIGMMRNFWSF